MEDREYSRRSRELYDQLVAGLEGGEPEKSIVVRTSCGEEFSPDPDAEQFNREATDEEAEEICRDAVPWSSAEKCIMSTFDVQAPRLCDPRGLFYPIRRCTTVNGHEANVYVIEDLEDRYRVLRRLWPFTPVPDKFQEIKDMHSDRTFPFIDSKVIRWCRFNFIVSPYYLESGGMAVDFCLPAK